MREAVHITSRRFRVTDRVVVVPNGLRDARDADYIWKILALDGRDIGNKIGIATEVALTGPVGCMPANHGVTGYLSLHPIQFTNATYRPEGRWPQREVMDAAILTSDGEVWTVTRRAAKVVSL